MAYYNDPSGRGSWWVNPGETPADAQVRIQSQAGGNLDPQLQASLSAQDPNYQQKLAAATAPPPAQRSNKATGAKTRIVWQNPATGQFETGLPDGSDPQHFATKQDLQSYQQSHGESGMQQVQSPEEAMHIVRYYTGNKDYAGYTGADYQAPQAQTGSQALTGQYGSGSKYQTRVVWQNPATGAYETGLPDGSDPQHFTSKDQLQAYMRVHGESNYDPVSSPTEAINLVRQFTGNKDYAGFTGADYKAPTPQAGSPAANGANYEHWYDSTHGQQGAPGGTPGGTPGGPGSKTGGVPPADTQLPTDYSSFGALAQPWTQPFESPTIDQPQPFDQPFHSPSGQDVLNNDPGYQFRLQQGMDQVQRQAAAKGTLDNGGTLKELMNYGQDYASNEYQNAYGRALTDYNTQQGTFRQNQATTYGAQTDAWNRSMGEYAQNRDIFRQNQNDIFSRFTTLAGLGQTAANQTGYYGMNAGNTGAGLMTGAANAQASGIVGSANAWGGAFTNLAKLGTDIYMNNRYPYPGSNPRGTSYGQQ